MDDIELAQEREQKDRESALAAMRARLPPPVSGPCGARDCESCGEPIAPRRLAAQPGADRCTECQQRREKYGV